MAAFCSREWWSDARHYQIAALATLLVYNVFWVDFGAQPLNSLLAIGGALATQALCTYLFALPQFDPRSPLITGLSLSLLLRADEPWLHALAGVIAIGSKFVLAGRRQAHLESGRLRHRGAAVCSVRATCGFRRDSGARRCGSPRCCAFFAILVLRAARRSDIAIFFLGSHAALLLARASGSAIRSRSRCISSRAARC